MRVYVDGDDLYCVDCHESTGELIPAELITGEEWDGDSTTRLRCANGEHEASPDEMERHRLPIPDPEYDGVPLTVEGGGSGESPC